MEDNNNNVVPQYYYTEKETDKISAYIEEQYGKIEIVGHEWVSPDIHCDIVIVPPTGSSHIINLLRWVQGHTR